MPSIIFSMVKKQSWCIMKVAQDGIGNFRRKAVLCCRCSENFQAAVEQMMRQSELQGNGRVIWWQVSIQDGYPCCGFSLLFSIYCVQRGCTCFSLFLDWIWSCCNFLYFFQVHEDQNGLFSVWKLNSYSNRSLWTT